MIKWLGMSCGGPCKSTKSQQSKLPSTSDKDINDFSINIGLHQWLTLSPYLLLW
jgi:hypothetical protein